MRHYFKHSFLLFLILVTISATKAQANDLCDPLVEPVTDEATIADILTVLAEEYNFSLSFPANMDKAFRVEESMKLSQLIKLLTADMNTVLLHKQIEGCTDPKLTELTVMPVGEETEYINIKQQAGSKNKDYIYIDNMEQYATEVLLDKRKARMGRMTPEQRVEFKIVKKRLRKELRDETRKNKREKKIKKQKEQGL